jgi:hypothetical protein
MQRAAPQVSFVVMLLGSLGVVACNVLTGASSLTTGDGDVAPGDASSGDSSGAVDASRPDTRPPTDPPQLVGWSYLRPVTLVSDASAALTNHAVLVTLPSGFDGGHAKPAGEDLRFRLPGATTDLEHYIEAWPADASPRLVWVRLPMVPPGASTMFVFYGNPSAATTSNFAATFPRAQRTAGNGAGSFVATGNIDVDWFELRAGDTLTVAPATPLVISARRVVVAGTIEGLAHGFGPGPLNGVGLGPGGGQPLMADGAGGGGYGGAGGSGGADTGKGGGGGAANGTPSADDIALGSGGGSSASKLGGAGGGAITILGWSLSASGTIRMNGAPGIGGPTGQSGGGGAGGGILLAASHLDLKGATLDANGGAGGPTTASAADGGGGGGGGRIKLRRRASGSYVAAASMLVTPGAGGQGGGSAAVGAPGAIGTVDVKETSNLLTGVETTLGPEQRTP